MRDQTNETKLVLCCTECKEPVVLTPRGGYYCVGCDYAPSMQDTFFRDVQRDKGPSVRCTANAPCTSDKSRRDADHPDAKCVYEDDREQEYECPHCKARFTATTTRTISSR